MDLIVVHRDSNRILFKGELVIMPGVGSTIHINSDKFEKEIEDIIDQKIKEGGLKVTKSSRRFPEEFEMVTDRYSLNQYAISYIGLDPTNFTTVLNLKHCPITGDTIAFVGKSTDLTSNKTNSTVVNTKPKITNREDDDSFLDGFLLAGAILSSDN